MFQREFWQFERGADALSALDGLRAIAVLLVVWRHGLFPFFEAHNGQAIVPLFGYDLSTILVNGWMGVDLFFVLSGFLIARLLLNQQERSGGLRFGPYLMKRALRIMPTYAFVIAIVVAGLIPYYQVSPQALHLRVAYHLLVLQDYLPSNIVVAFWSLGVEEKFYLAAPFMLGSVFAVRSLRTRFILVLSVIAASILLRVWSAFTIETAGATMTYLEFLPAFRYPFHACLDALGLGMLALLLYRHATDAPCSWLHRHPEILFWAGAAWLLVLTAPRILLAEINWWDQTLQPAAIALGFAAMLLGAALGGGPQRFLGSHALLVVARISYPLYLVHMTVIPLAWVLAGAGTDGNLTDLARFLPVYATLAFALAFAVHFTVEKPFLSLRNRIGRTYQRRSAQVGAAVE